MCKRRLTQKYTGQIGRANVFRKQITRNTIVIDTDGERVGEVNGLAVYQLDHLSFGKPSRISCRVRMGRGEVIDIEREVALGGPLHTKGVLILSSYLASRFTGDGPLALSASLVFEQSYGGVDGDSASSTELYALLSAISEFPHPTMLRRHRFGGPARPGSGDRRRQTKKLKASLISVWRAG